MRRRFQSLFFVLPCLASACGSTATTGATNLSFIGLPTALGVSSSTLSFTNTGAAYATTVTVADPNFTTASTCTGIATIATTSATTLRVTPVAAGSCTITVSANSASASIAVTVTQTVVGGH